MGTKNPVKDHLKLSGGRDIAFSEDYHRYHAETFGYKTSVAKVAETSINAAGGAEKLDYKDVSKKFTKDFSSVKLAGYVSKLVPTYQMLELFRDTRFEPPHGRTLDIGCGMGVHLRLLKAWGVISESVGVDIYDICTGFDSSSLNYLQKRFKLLRYAEWMQDRIAKTPEERRTPFQQAIMKRLPTVRWFSENYGHRPSKNIYNMSFKTAPTIDKLIIGNVYDIDEKFDLITSFAAIDWLTVDEIMPKVSSMLNEGGFFYMWVTNWWHNMNTTNIFGHFPFAPQRMNKEEFAEYVKETMPENADNILKSYSYFDPTHPTLSDYIESAGRAGLIPLAWKENILPNILGMAGAVNSVGMAELDQEALYQAWSDAKVHRPELRLDDMYPYSRSILFRKPEASEGLTYESLSGIREKQDFHYQPTSVVGKTAKSLAEKIFLRRPKNQQRKL